MSNIDELRTARRARFSANYGPAALDRAYERMTRACDHLIDAADTAEAALLAPVYERLEEFIARISRHSTPLGSEACDLLHDLERARKELDA